MNAEPISDTTPPKATKETVPEPTPPTPEAPKKGLKVEVLQPNMLYVIALLTQHGEDDFGKKISTTRINDRLFRNEETRVSAYKPTRGYGKNIDGTFSLSSDLYFSDERIRQEDHGYFSDDKVQRIQAILAERGINTTYSKMFGERSVVTVEKDGQYVEVSFGLPNREDDEDSIRKEVEADRRKYPDKSGYAETYDLPKIEKKLTNYSINLTLVNETRAKSGREGYPKLENEASFSRAASMYVNVYEQVVNAIYQEEEVTPPDTSIILRPPMSSSDTLTQIKSVETPTPTVVTKEQLQAELGGFNEIAGQDAAVVEAKRLVLAINHPEIFEKRGVKRPKGILFYGPPGTGKTLIAKAVAREASADFLEVSAADIGTKWYGESERLMQEVFNIANKAVISGRRVVLFFDELDSLAPARGEAHEATKKVVATLLQNMDGMKANPNVTVIAASNRPQDIDPALKRPGRIDKLIQVGLPNAKGRQAILNVHMEKAKKAATAPGKLFSKEIDLTQIGQTTEGMSGADLANLVNLTLEEKTMAELEGEEWTPIKTEEMLATAHRLGLIREEKRKIGFIIPDRTHQNSGTTTAGKE